jgi:hypothetical protein
MYGDETVIEVRISPSQADEFLDRIVNDPAFYEQLSQNPNDALAQYGISVPPSFLPEQVELPSPDQIRQARDAMDTGEFSEEIWRYSYEDGGSAKVWVILWLALWFRKFRPYL